MAHVPTLTSVVSALATTAPVEAVPTARHATLTLLLSLTMAHVPTLTSVVSALATTVLVGDALTAQPVITTPQRLSTTVLVLPTDCPLS